jgi:hypothetical protein
MASEKKEHRSELAWVWLFHVDDLAAYQYRQTFCRQLPLFPELALVIAVLEDALVTFKEKLLASGGKHQKLFEDAEDWIWRSDGEGFFSFENVCAELDISPGYLRRQLLRWKNDAMAERRERVPQSGHPKKPGRRRYQRALVRHGRQSQPGDG